MESILAMVPEGVVKHMPSFDLSNVSTEKLISENLTKQKKLLLSGGLAASITSSTYNSLDCLRVRWQTLPQSSKFRHYSSRGILYFTRCIIKKEGFVNGLCRPGVMYSAAAGTCSASLRFGFYEHIRDAIMYYGGEGENEKSSVHMFMAGFTCGGVAYFITTPLQVLKTRVQASQNSSLYTIDANGELRDRIGCSRGSPINFRSFIKEEGFFGLWKSSSTVTARGALFSAGQMLGYDGFKTFCKSNEIAEDGVRLHIASSIVAAFFSTALSTPADFVFARYVSSSSKLSIVGCIRLIHSENGILGFWRGSGLAFVRLCPVILSYSMLYEQFRKQLGLGYLS